MQERLPGEFMANDLDVITEDLVAMRMVVMKMRVDDITHRLCGDRLQFIQQDPCGRRRNMRIDERDVGVVDNDCGVASNGERTCADGVVNVISDFVKPI